MTKPPPFQQIIARIQKNVRNYDWNCLFPNCQNKAINSHLLQRNGILDSIAENGHLIEMKGKDIFRWTETNSPFEFKSVGINKAISLPLFCKNHDLDLFKPIETKNIKLTDYISQLLFSYRALNAEIRKKEINTMEFERILNSKNLIGQVDFKLIELFVSGSKKGLEYLYLYKEVFEKEIHDNSGCFHFEVVKYPLFKVYASASFSPLDNDKVNPLDGLPLHGIFIHLIPDKTHLNIIVGYNKEYSSTWITDYVSSWNNLDPSQVGSKLTELFATRIDSWGLAPSLYHSIKKSTLDSLLDYWDKNAMNLNQNQKFDFNLFENNNPH